MIGKTERGVRPLRVNELFDFAGVLSVAPELLLEWEVSAEILDDQIAQVEKRLQADEEGHRGAREQLDHMEKLRTH